MNGEDFFSKRTAFRPGVASEYPQLLIPHPAIPSQAATPTDGAERSREPCAGRLFRNRAPNGSNAIATPATIETRTTIVKALLPAAGGGV